MGTAVFSDMVADLKLQFGNRNDLETPTNWYQKWINTAYLALTCRNTFFGEYKFRPYFPQLEASTTATTTAGTAYVAVPTDCLVLRRLFNTTDDAFLKWISNDEYIRKTGRATTASRGTPTQYTRMGSYIYLSPTPVASTTSLTIHYRKVPAVLSDDADTTAIGPEWDDAIVKLAAIQGQLRMHEYDFAEIEKKHWADEVLSLMNIYAQETRAGDQTISKNPEWT